MCVCLLMVFDKLVLNTKKLHRRQIYIKLTLGPYQYNRNLCGISVVGHFIEVIGHGIIADFVLETENEYHRIHPSSKLKQNKIGIIK